MKTFITLLLIAACYIAKAQVIPVDQTEQQKAYISSFPAPTGFVNDYSHLLTMGEKSSLENQATNFQLKTTGQIAVIIIDDLPVFFNSSNDLGTAIGKKWGVGVKGKNNGIVILICFKSHLGSISTGLGIQTILTNAVCAQIISDDMIPNFRAGNYYSGIKAAVDKIMQKL